MNYRAIFSVGLALALVALCAWLPEIVGYFQDRENTGNVEFYDVNPVSLTFTGEEMSMSERLYTMVAYNYVTQIPPSLAKMTPEEAEAVGEEMLAQMQAAGFLPDTLHSGDSDYSVAAIPAIWGIDTETGCIFWRVTMYWDNCCVAFKVEDSTGAVCNIWYEEYRGQYWGQWQMQEDTALDLAALLLGQLGEEFAEYDRDYLQENMSSSELWDSGNNYLVMELIFDDSISGLQGLDVRFYEYGFTVAFL